MTDAELNYVRVSMGRRFLSLIYESLLLFSFSFFVALLVTLIEFLLGVVPRDRASFFVAQGYSSFLIQLFFFICIGLYFTYCWHQTGQTLAMRSWRVRLVCRDGRPLRWGRLWMRYFLAFSLFPINFFWGFFDPEGQFLHDRWCRTMLVSSDG